MPEAVVLSHTQRGVCTITLNRPERKNAQDTALLTGLQHALQSALDDDATRVVILRGAGGNFCSGMDLGADFSSDSSRVYDTLMETLYVFDKPMIAAVDGVAVGGGATLALHADYIFVGADLRLRLPFVSLGLAPEFASSYVLPQLIGQRRAGEMMYNAEWHNAEQVYALGIATAVFDNASLHQQALAKAKQLAQSPGGALRATKRCIKAPHIEPMRAAVRLETEMLTKQIGTAENIEAFTAFFEKRAPIFYPDE